jgi:magnesium chelatase subunit D
MTAGSQVWARAQLALELFALDPARLRGVTVKARAGPVRDVFLEAVAGLPGPVRKVHSGMGFDALLGGLDLSQTLASGQVRLRAGLLDQPGTVVLAMAERCPPDIAAILAAKLDTNPDLSLIMLDEGADPDEQAPQTLRDRLAFHVELDGIGRLEAKPFRLAAHPVPRHGSRSAKDVAHAIRDLTILAQRLGINTLRAPTFAVETAKALAHMDRRTVPNDADIQSAAELVLAPRATRLPEPEPAEEEQPEAPAPQQTQAQDDRLPDDMLIDAVRAVLPLDLLDTLATGGTPQAKGSGAGQKKRGNRRGRPIPSQPGRLGGQSRLDLIATLRAAAPWQKLRGRTGARLCVYPSDIRLKRFEEKSDRILVFAVDASGSAALARLGEAKGAVELLLARAYAARDHVALIAFRGDKADVLLPPTRSLVQTKRRLASLPGGGGTPLAHGLKTAAELALHSQSQGMSPTLAILTDGRANIALDGSGNRAKAGEDASQMARWIRARGLPAIVLDLGTRPQPALAGLARDMAGTYLPLPRADAHRLSDALEQALDHGLGA